MIGSLIGRTDRGSPQPKHWYLHYIKSCVDKPAQTRAQASFDSRNKLRKTTLLGRREGRPTPLAKRLGPLWLNATAW